MFILPCHVCHPSVLCSACLAFAGEAVLYFDLAAAVVSQLEGSYLAPGTKLSGDARVHGGLITAGVYALLASLTGFYGVLRRSLRAVTIFYILQIINTAFAVAVLLIVVMAGSTTFSTLAAQIPGITLNIYMVVVVKSYRLQFLEATPSAIPAAHDLEPVTSTSTDKYRDAIADDFEDDDLTVTTKDVQLTQNGGKITSVKVGGTIKP
jgi:hypothetical protein